MVAGVDEINHMPGFRYASDIEKHSVLQFEIAESDARRAAKQGTFVVTTIAGSVPKLDTAQRRVQDQLNARNLSVLLKYRVHLALGSDSYRSDTVPEAFYVNSLQVMPTLHLLNIWCSSTVETIFPGRKVGQLKEGYEASFLVLKSNPIDDFSAVEKITLEVKQGHLLSVGNSPRQRTGI
jgi:imidazolonepropionase-like amidohydrolase